MADFALPDLSIANHRVLGIVSNKQVLEINKLLGEIELLHARLKEFYDFDAPNDKYDMFAIPNGAFFSTAAAYTKKLEAVKKIVTVLGKQRSDARSRRIDKSSSNLPFFKAYDAHCALAKRYCELLAKRQDRLKASSRIEVIFNEMLLSDYYLRNFGMTVNEKSRRMMGMEKARLDDALYEEYCRLKAEDPNTTIFVSQYLPLLGANQTFTLEYNTIRTTENRDSEAERQLDENIQAGRAMQGTRTFVKNPFEVYPELVDKFIDA